MQRRHVGDGPLSRNWGWKINVKLVDDVLIHIEIVILLVNIIEIVVILIVVIVVEIVGNVSNLKIKEIKHAMINDCQLY